MSNIGAAAFEYEQGNYLLAVEVSSNKGAMYIVKIEIYDTKYPIHELYIYDKQDIEQIEKELEFNY